VREPPGLENIGRPAPRSTPAIVLTFPSLPPVVIASTASSYTPPPMSRRSAGFIKSLAARESAVWPRAFSQFAGRRRWRQVAELRQWRPEPQRRQRFGGSAVVPEPGTLGLLLVGALGLLHRRRTV